MWKNKESLQKFYFFIYPFTANFPILKPLENVQKPLVSDIFRGL